MVIIRLARGGSKKRPFYRIVAANSTSPRDGKSLERLGFFNPIATGQEERLRLERDNIAAWVAKGAQVTDRVRDLLKEWDKAAV